MSLFPSVRFMLGVAAPAQFPADVGWEMAVAGKSNSGKSSAINSLLARKSLARTSRTPGRTQLFNYFELVPGKRLVDLPGYGHAEVRAATRATWGPLGAALRERKSFSALLLTVDTRRGVSDMDLALLDWADLPASAMHVLLSKSDKFGRAQGLSVMRDAQATLAGRASCQLFSALKGAGLEEARSVLQRWVGEATHKIKSPGGEATGAD
jgi:GTP-binding protein